MSGDAVTGFNVTACLSYDGPGLPDDLEFEYEIVLDSVRQAVNRRAVFTTTESTSISGTLMTSLNQQQCVHYGAFVLSNIRDLQTPITFALTHRLVEQSPDPNSPAPILSDSASTYVTNSISFHRECASSTCYPDLSVSPTWDVTELIIGSAQSVSVDVQIVNDGDDAFLSRLDIAEVEGLYFVSVSKLSTGAFASCSYSSVTRVRSCDIGNPVHAGDTLALNLQYQTETDAILNGHVLMNMTASSVDAEKPEDVSDNAATVFIPVYARANLTLQGLASPDYLVMSIEEYTSLGNQSWQSDGPQITHTISVVNNGPSAVGPTIVKSYWPMRIESGEVLVNITDVTMDTGDQCSITSMISSAEQNDTSGASSKVAVSYDDSSAVTYTLIADCDLLPECYVITCALEAHQVTSSVVIDIVATIIPEAAFLDTAVETVVVMSTTSVEVEGSIYTGVDFSPHPTVSPVKTQTEIGLEFTPSTTEKEVPLWVYLVSAIAGLILLVIMILVLYLLGFFKRKKITPEEKAQIREDVRRSRLYYDDMDVGE